MNKSELAAKLAKRADISKSKAEEIVDAIFSTKPGHGIIAIELDAGREVSIYGFGSFGTKWRGTREGRNPATGELIRIEGAKYPTFKASKGLKDRVADGQEFAEAAFPHRECPGCGRRRGHTRQCKYR